MPEAPAESQGQMLEDLLPIKGVANNVSIEYSVMFGTKDDYSTLAIISVTEI